MAKRTTETRAARYRKALERAHKAAWALDKAKTELEKARLAMPSNERIAMASELGFVDLYDVGECLDA